MHRAAMVIVPALVLVIIGLFIWGVAEGEAAAKPIRSCLGEGEAEKPLPAAERIAACSRAIEIGRIGPEELAGAYDVRGTLRLELGQHAVAITDQDKALSFQPDARERLNGACWARAVAGVELGKARELCGKALAGYVAFQGDSKVVLNPPPVYSHIFDSRGLVGLKERRFEDAFADYDLAVKARPDCAHCLYGRGIAALRLGRELEGRRDIEAALKLELDVAPRYQSYGVRL